MTDTPNEDTDCKDTTEDGDRPRLIRRHDQFAKQLLDQSGLADIFLRERLPAALTARLTPEPASDRSESFVDPTLAERRGDRVHSLALADGPQVLVWAMIEHKSAPDPDSILQTLGYVAGLATRAATRIEMPNGSLCLIPAPVFAVILYHGERPWPLPTILGPAYRLPPDTASIGLLDFSYTLVDLGAIPDAELSHDPELQAGLLVLKYATRDDDPATTLERLLAAAAGAGLTVVAIAVRYLLGAGTFDRAHLRATLARVLPGQEDNMLSQAALEIMAESRAEGMAQGLSQGISRGKADLLLRLMRRRFDNIPPTIEQRVLMAEGDDLDRWGEAVLDASTIEDVFSTPRH
jgi:hypothetical protein